jgi:exodeoxyribonuclease V alpha subunit
MKEEAQVSALTRRAADLVCELSGGENALLRTAVERLFAVLEEGGTCVELAELGDAQQVREQLLASGVVGLAGELRPMIVNGPRLYLQRYHDYEARLAASLLKLAGTAAPACGGGVPARALCVVTGGPGTGKTTLASKLLAGVAGARGGEMSVALAAPTGRAAARLRECVDAANVPGLRLTHGTVHRLLGPKPHSAFFTHDASRPLPFDVVVLDETSMMDLPLMAKLVDAIDPARTRLVVLGDPGQLPSIHSGCVLADIAEAATLAPAGAVAACSIRLTHNHRAAQRPRLSALIDAVRDGDTQAALDILAGGGEVSLERAPSASRMQSFVAASLSGYIEKLRRAETPQDALALLGSSRIVCMLRQGPMGADAMNEAAKALALPRSGSSGGFFHGMPLIVSVNDRDLNLYNGDTGVVLSDGARLHAWFHSAEGPRRVALHELPPCESAYALTVHRAQGSEYGDVTVMTGPADHPGLTRELLYTAISRAGRSVRILGDEALLRAAIAKEGRRSSGLAERLARG